MSTKKRLLDLIDSLTDSSVKVSDCLRNARVLAAFLDAPDFDEWLQNELDGYDDCDNIPDYRVVPAGAQGEFLFPMISNSQMLEINMEAFKNEETKKNLSEIPFTEGVADLESLASVDSNVEANGGMIKRPWPPIVAASAECGLISSFQGQKPTCARAWNYTGRNKIVQILEAVKNKLLDHCLRLMKADPTMDAELVLGSRVTQAEKDTAQEFPQTINAPHSNINFGKNATQKLVHSETYNDIESLTKMLSGLGLDGDLLKELHSIDDSKDDKAPLVRSWLKSACSKLLAVCRGSCVLGG